MDTGLPAFEELQSVLSTMQFELTRREWVGDLYQRAERARKFREQLWAAIAAYCDEFA